MKKNCPDCSYELTKKDYRQFLKEKSGEWMHCGKCQGKMYIVIPENKRFLMVLLNVLVFLLMFAITCGITYLWFAGSIEFLSTDANRGDIRLLFGGLFMIVGGIYLIMTFASRAIHWKLAVAQKSPFT